MTRTALFLLACALSACGPAAPPEPPEAPSPFEGTPFASAVLDVSIGDGGGFGADGLPAIVTGPPKGNGDAQGSLDVVSLGAGGSIVLELGVDVVDGEGADLVVFENAFLGAGLVFSEPGVVAVSDDGESWTPFPCDVGEPGSMCAGMTPVYADDAESALAEDAGGDRFDLADVGVERARFLRVSDATDGGGAADGKAGFDLDAVAVLHGQAR